MTPATPPHTCNGETMVIPDVDGDYCPASDEGVFVASESACAIAVMLALHRL